VTNAVAVLIDMHCSDSSCRSSREIELHYVLFLVLERSGRIIVSVCGLSSLSACEALCLSVGGVSRQST
jgi:hypothetical protein